jgi:hypothetical protein
MIQGAGCTLAGERVYCSEVPTLLFEGWEIEKEGNSRTRNKGIYFCFFTTRCLDRRWRVCWATCVDAGFEQSEYHRAPGGRIRRACHAHDGASRGVPHHRVGLTPDCRQGSGNNSQDRRCSGRLEPCPIYQGCSRQCSISQLRRGAKIETYPRLSRPRKLQGLTDTTKDVALGDTAGVAFVNSSP